MCSSKRDQQISQAGVSAARLHHRAAQVTEDCERLTDQVQLLSETGKTPVLQPTAPAQQHLPQPGLQE